MAKVDIANKALTYLGEETILSFNDEKDHARVINIHYDACKRHLLQSHNWNFATVRLALTQITPHTDTEYPYAFQIPANSLKVMRTCPEFIKWKRFQDQIWTTVENLTVEYIAEVDEAQFSPAFEKALQYFLASEIALAIGGSNSAKNDAFSMYQQAAIEAIEANDTEIGVLSFDEEPGEHLRHGFMGARRAY